eukprot:UN22183
MKVHLAEGGVTPPQLKCIFMKNTTESHLRSSSYLKINTCTFLCNNYFTLKRMFFEIIII